MSIILRVFFHKVFRSLQAFCPSQVRASQSTSVPRSCRDPVGHRAAVEPPGRLRPTLRADVLLNRAFCNGCALGSGGKVGKTSVPERPNSLQEFGDSVKLGFVAFLLLSPAGSPPAAAAPPPKVGQLMRSTDFRQDLPPGRSEACRAASSEEFQPATRRRISVKVGGSLQAPPRPRGDTHFVRRGSSSEQPFAMARQG